ncbi:hypothetical protein M2347_000346 [Chryseobacterium sp. H1D6B]|uniref:hypothetical protein n=1 Tax=Chryseobacterium sp. H1D6B TaxID=2940588 RepID=UPI0015CCAEE1|nr:hypothetical protein [Chryseobacterium sp. H1D6B]MDH6250619.1 hypothetical protein [Chryseobacterium sp. H1D6B]
MKKITILPLFTLFLFTAKAQQGSIGIGTTSPNSSAVLDVTASNKGLKLPVISLSSTADVTAVTTPKTGFIIYNTAVAGSGMTAVDRGLYAFNGTAWEKMLTKANVVTEVEKIPFITPVFAASNIGTSSSITAGTNTSLTFNTLYQNLPAGAQGAAGAYTGYTIQQTGMYVVSYAVDTRNTAGDVNGNTFVTVQKNGATVCTYGMERDYQFAGISSTCALGLSTGDVIRFMVQSNGADYQIANTNVSISKILNN